MGRRPKSDAEKELSGAYDKNPQRRKKAGSRTKESGSCNLGPAPRKFLDKYSPTAADHLEAWNEIQAAAKAGGVTLVEAHRLRVESLARAMVIMRRSYKSSDCMNVSALLKELGIGKIPEKREIDKAAEKPEDDEWSHLTTPPARTVTPVQ